jgi:N-acyl homoserine lactone hydrolase
MAAELALWRIDGGTIQVDELGPFSDTFDYEGQARTFAVGCYLIRHPQGFLLWDAGLPVSLLGAPLGGTPKSASLARTIREQLRELGVEPERIRFLGLSHTHIDHAGQAAGFPGATLLIGRADLEALRTGSPPADTDPAAFAPWLSGGSAVEPVDGDRDVFGDGTVRMLAMPGHTPGHHALLVRLARTGPLLLAGDTAMFLHQLEAELVPAANADRARSLASMARLKGIAARLGALVILPHDTGDVPRLPAFPAAAD